MSRAGNIRINTCIAAVAAMAAWPQTAAAQAFACPKTGGHMVFAQEAKVNSLDQHTSSTISTRNVAMNIFEALMTRDENMNPIPELAAAVNESADGLTYTFKLRQGIKFHNGKPMTIGRRGRLVRPLQEGRHRPAAFSTIVDNWEAPDAQTFVIRLKAAAADLPREPELVQRPDRDRSGGEHRRSADAAEADRHRAVRVRRVRAPTATSSSSASTATCPTRATRTSTGFGGYKVACLDTVTFRIVTEAGARVAGLETGELHGAEDVPAKSQADAEEQRQHRAQAAAELLDPDRHPEPVRAADRQSEVPPGDPGRARHGRDHGGGDRRRLPAQHRLPVSRPGRSTPRPARRPTTRRTPTRPRSCWRKVATRARSSSCSPTRTTRTCTTRPWSCRAAQGDRHERGADRCWTGRPRCRSSRTRAIRAAGTSSSPAGHQHVARRRRGDAVLRAAVQHLPAQGRWPDAEFAKPSTR